MLDSALDRHYQLYFRGNRIYDRLAKVLGETPQTLYLMRLLLDEEEGLSQAVICQGLFVPKQTMSRILKEMTTKGLIRESPSSRDGREKIFSLTETGKLHAREVTKRLNAIESTCLADIYNELNTVNEFNDKYLTAIEEYLSTLEEE